MSQRYLEEFCDDVVRVVRGRESGVTLVAVARDFGIHEMTLNTWLRRADVEGGIRSGVTQAENAKPREVRKRVRLLEQEYEVLPRAAAYPSWANLPGKGSTRS